MNTVKLGLAAALLAVSSFAVAQPAAPLEQVIEGQVSGVLEPGMFWVQSGADKVLVYASAAQAKGVRIGDQVKIRGTVPRDWVKLARHELSATAIQTAR